MPRPSVYQVRITPRAQRDLDEVHDYLATAASRAIAKRVLSTLIIAINSLRRLPYKFAVPRTGRPRGIAVRSMVVYPYLVRYRIEESSKIVRVLFVRHGARRQP